MRSLKIVVVLGLLAVGCNCGPATVVDAGTGGGSAGGGGGATGGGAAGGGTGGALGGGAGGGDADSGIDDAGAGDDAGTDAGVDAGCSISVAPAALTFGPTAPGCASRQVLTVSNTCSRDYAAGIVISGPFSVELDGGPLLVSARSTTQVPFLFQPTDAGAETGEAYIIQSMDALPVVPLSGLGALAPIVTDTFRSPNRVRANLLFVVSDGPGMTPAQQSLAANFPAMVQYAAANQFDFRIGVLAGRSDGGTLVGGVMTQNRPNLVQQFTSSVSLGTAGTPTESCLERAVQELSDGGAAWLYARATFSLVCVQNTLENTDAGAALVQQLATLVGNPTHFTVNALANFEPGCAPPDDVTLRSAIDSTGGNAASICPGADGGIGPVQGRLLGDYENTFVLSRKPDTMAAIQVQVDGVTVPSVDPNTMAPLWNYDAALNAIVFAAVAAPQPGAAVGVRYSPSCMP